MGQLLSKATTASPGIEGSVKDPFTAEGGLLDGSSLESERSTSKESKTAATATRLSMKVSAIAESRQLMKELSSAPTVDGQEDTHVATEQATRRGHHAPTSDPLQDATEKPHPVEGSNPKAESRHD